RPSGGCSPATGARSSPTRFRACRPVPPSSATPRRPGRPACWTPCARTCPRSTTGRGSAGGRSGLAPLLGSLAVLAAASLLSFVVVRAAETLHASDEYVGLLLAGAAWPARGA